MNNAAHWRSFCPATGAGLLKRITALLGILMFILSGTAFAAHPQGLTVCVANCCSGCYG
jgi:hypothetical protein